MSVGFGIAGVIGSLVAGIGAAIGGLLSLAGAATVMCGKAAVKGTIALCSFSKKMIIKVGHGIGRLVEAMKDAYSEYKEVRAGYDERFEEMIARMNSNEAATEKWIKAKTEVKAEDEEFWEEAMLKEEVSVVLESAESLTNELMMRAKAISEEWDGEFDLPPSEKKILIEKSKTLLEDVDNQSRRNLAYVKAILGEDVTSEELEDVDEAIAVAVTREDFPEKLAVMLDAIEELDAMDSHCTKPHGRLKEMLLQVIAECNAGGISGLEQSDEEVTEETADIVEESPRQISVGVDYSKPLAQGEVKQESNAAKRTAKTEGKR